MQLNLAYRWFCRLGLDGEVPDHSTFSKNRHGRFRDCDLLRKLFETVVQRCMAEGLVDGAALAVDASLIACELKSRCCPKAARSRVPSMKRPEMLRAKLRRLMPMSGPGANGRKSRCCLPISNAFYVSTGSG